MKKLMNDKEVLPSLDLGSLNNTQCVFSNTSLAKSHTFYLCDEIKSPSEYTTWFEMIRSAGENDIIIFRINSPGGNLFTALQFVRVINETKATVVASVEGICMSAATIIFLAAKHWEISAHSIFMFHNYSSVSAGKGGELYDNIIHERKWSEKLWGDVYGGFFTPQEITSILYNKDIWLTAEDVGERLERRAKHMAAKVKACTTSDFDTPAKKAIKKVAKKAKPKSK